MSTCKEMVRRWRLKVYCISYGMMWLIILFMVSSIKDMTLWFALFPLLLLVGQVLPLILFTMYGATLKLREEVDSLKEQIESLKTDGSNN